MEASSAVLTHSLPSIKELEIFNKVCFRNKDPLDIPKEYYLSPNNVTVNPEGSEIIPFLKGKHIFLTGATGFVGILTLEKLLRACPDIGRIYLLIRNKKCRDVNYRMEKYLKNAVFDPLRQIYPDFQEKITPICGDMADDNLGISDQDRNTITQNVEIIIHSAAIVNFIEKFKKAVNINVRGTQQMLQLAKECKKLLVFAYVSTAFSTPTIHIEEKVVKYDGDVYEILDIVQKYSDEDLEVVSKKYMGDFNNTYAFTKHLAEQIVMEHVPQLPVVIFRPSVIVSTYREPLRGWTNNIYGPMAMILLTGLGFQHVILANADQPLDTMPADYVVNGLIAVIYKTALDKNQHSKNVYHCVSKPSMQIEVEQVINIGKPLMPKIIPVKSLLPPSVALISPNETLFTIFGFFLHYIPAILIDFGLKMAGIKTPIKVFDGMRKLHKMSPIIHYYGSRRWKIDYDNMDDLWRQLSPADKNAFPFNVNEVNTKLLLVNIFNGIRVFILKDPMDTVPKARILYRIKQYVLNTILTIMAIGAFLLLNKLYNFIFL